MLTETAPIIQGEYICKALQLFRCGESFYLMPNGRCMSRFIDESIRLGMTWLLQAKVKFYLKQALFVFAS